VKKPIRRQPSAGRQQKEEKKEIACVAFRLRRRHFNNYKIDLGFIIEIY